jgi:hypothetical protein
MGLIAIPNCTDSNDHTLSSSELYNNPDPTLLSFWRMPENAGFRCVIGAKQSVNK